MYRSCMRELVGVQVRVTYSTSYYIKDTNTSYVQITNG